MITLPSTLAGDFCSNFVLQQPNQPLAVAGGHSPCTLRCHSSVLAYTFKSSPCAEHDMEISNSARMLFHSLSSFKSQMHKLQMRRYSHIILGFHGELQRRCFSSQKPQARLNSFFLIKTFVSLCMSLAAPDSFTLNTPVFCRAVTFIVCCRSAFVTQRTSDVYSQRSAVRAHALVLVLLSWPKRWYCLNWCWLMLIYWKATLCLQSHSVCFSLPQTENRDRLMPPTSNSSSSHQTGLLSVTEHTMQRTR